MNERRDKKWNETKTNDSWSIFKIMGEFVEGYEKLAAIGPCISIFGSARTHPENKFYKLAEDISQAIVERGYGVITGGGPGIMEAANKGADNPCSVDISCSKQQTKAQTRRGLSSS